MPKILFNPTNEEFRTFYVGEEVVIPPGAKIKVDDPRGRQVLNVLAPRGLMELEFGDEGAGEIEKAEKGRERNREFKRKQVMDFNAINDQRQQRRLPYLIPESFLKEYARELGLELYEPYSSKDANKAEGAALREEIQKRDDQLAEMRRSNAAMQTEMAEMRRLMQKMLTHGASGEPDQAAAESADWEDVRRQYKGINKTHFANWVGRNFDIIRGYPADMQAEIREKYERLYNTPYPLSALEAGAQQAA